MAGLAAITPRAMRTSRTFRSFPITARAGSVGGKRCAMDMSGPCGGLGVGDPARVRVIVVKGPDRGVAKGRRKSRNRKGNGLPILQFHC
jgi:hypothetical protein